MKGYTFVYSDTVDPAYDVGVYLNKEKAWERFKELTKQTLDDDYPFYNTVFYEDGYGEYYCPDNDKEFKEAKQKGDWDLCDKLLKKHILTDLDTICKSLCDDYEYPPDGFYQLVEVNIIE